MYLYHCLSGFDEVKTLYYSVQVLAVLFARLLIRYLIVLQRQRLAVISAVEELTVCVEAVATVIPTVKHGGLVVISSCHGIAPNVAVLRGFWV